MFPAYHGRMRLLSLLILVLFAQPAGSGRFDTIPNFSCYRTVEGTFATAEGIVAKYPHLATWIDVGDSWEKSVDEGGLGH